MVADYLKQFWPYADRRVKTGAKDTGDIGGVPCVIEVKNCATMELASWVDEATTEAVNAKAPFGVVWHHRRGKGSPAEWYVTMTGRDFVRVLQMLDISDALPRPGSEPYAINARRHSDR